MSDSASQWTVAHQAPLSKGFSWQDCWSGLPCSFPGDLTNPGIEPTSVMSPALEVASLTLVPPGKICNLKCGPFWLLQTQYNFLINFI